MSVQAEVKPAVRFEPRRLGHANFYVSDHLRSIEFYNKVCGFTPVGREDSIKAGFLSNGNSHHDFGLVEASEKARVGKDGKVQSIQGHWKGPGLNHFGWETDNEAHLVEAYRRAMDSGYEISRCLDHGGSHAIYLFDPDGNIHEFYADMTRDWRSIFHGGGDLGLITSQWTPGDPPPLTEALWDPDPKFDVVEEAPAHPLRAGRGVFIVSDFDRLLDFYTQIAGFDLAYAAPDKSYAFLRGQASTRDYHCAVFAQAPGLEVGYHHVGLEMPDEASVEQAEAALTKQGVAIEMSVDNASKRALFLRDPDQLLLEFYYTRSPDFAALANEAPEKRPFLA